MTAVYPVLPPSDCRASWPGTLFDAAPHPMAASGWSPGDPTDPFFVAGGSPLVARGTSSTAPVRTLDVAPSVGKIFGLSEPRGGYDGRARIALG